MSHTTWEATALQLLAHLGESWLWKGRHERHLCDKTGISFPQSSLGKNKGSKSTSSLRLVLAKIDGVTSHRTAQFCCCCTWEWSCPWQSSFGKERKMLCALICSNSLIIQVTPLHSSLIGNTCCCCCSFDWKKSAGDAVFGISTGHKMEALSHRVRGTTRNPVNSV